MSNQEENLKEKYKREIKEALEDLKTPGRRYRQIPNILTASRLLSPLAILPAALSGNVLLTAGLAAGFGLTDLADGTIARKLKIESDLGADLDAITDKVFVGTLLIASAFFNPVLLCNLGLEGIIAGINIKEKLSGKDTGSTVIGKYKTWAAMGLAGLGLIAPQIGLNGLVNILALGTAAMQGLTIHSYLTKYSKEGEISQSSKMSTMTDVSPADEIPVPEYLECKSKEGPNSIPTTSEEQVQSPATLAELKELSDFLHQEQQRQQCGAEERPNVYQKIKPKED